MALTASPCFASDTSREEKTCRDIGFKPKTEKYAGCVLELYGRRISGGQDGRLSNSTNKDPVAIGDGSPDDRTCRSYSLLPGTVEYSDCRMKIDAARVNAQAEHDRYRRELLMYQSQIAEAKRQKDQESNLRLMELGLEMMGGGGRRSSGSSAALPRPPVLPENQHIFLPDGRMITCNTSGSTTNCF